MHEGGEMGRQAQLQSLAPRWIGVVGGIDPGDNGFKPARHERARA